MLKLLSALLSVIDKALGLWRDQQIKEQGRQEVVIEAAKVEQQHEAEAIQAVTVPDPVRDERLRARFDRACRK